MMPQTEFSSSALATQILHITQQVDKLTSMSDAAYRLAEMHAAEKVAAICSNAAKSI